jgi:hypothetical protein
LYLDRHYIPKSCFLVISRLFSRYPPLASIHVASRLYVFSYIATLLMHNLSECFSQNPSSALFISFYYPIQTLIVTYRDCSQDTTPTATHALHSYLTSHLSKRFPSPRQAMKLRTYSGPFVRIREVSLATPERSELIYSMQGNTQGSAGKQGWNLGPVDLTGVKLPRSIVIAHVIRHQRVFGVTGRWTVYFEYQSTFLCTRSCVSHNLI